ncbi:hypothetical protein [Streptomyces sp. 3214.6]|uniref:hypothetical protein n=1 Tax=Streptomyces sp. 3214.6 TaxID=1882757 RepID=UPI00090A012B|nr:hypothetical protein [Streptomyces sp. 3214.6]SHI66505.1 hypothetical protein SAMN05444521_8177 [Streptomyces sp. 3214.6]
MDADHRVITIDRHEWALKSPAHHTEVEKTVAVAVEARATQAAHGKRTGDIHITASDDEVIVSFEAERPKNPKRGNTVAGQETTDA